MMTLRELLAAFIVEESNFNVLHWNASGKRFDRIHALAQDWYDRCASDKDAVSEMAMRLGERPVHYGEAIEILKDCNTANFKIITSDKLYDSDSFTEESQKCLDDICKSICAVMVNPNIKDRIENVGIKSSLEAMYEAWDLDRRYKNKRRSND